jgi:hypothetical protein
MPNHFVLDLALCESHRDYRAVRPAFEGTVVDRLNGFSCSVAESTNNIHKDYIRHHLEHIDILRGER